MRLPFRDFVKFPLTKAELRKMSGDGRRWAQARVRELVRITEEESKRKPTKDGPRY